VREMSDKARVLIICTANSCRSQMAEGWVRHDLGERVEVFSAGTHPWIVHPVAREVMAESGVDISGHASKSILQFAEEEFDLVITVCDSAREECPVFPGAKRHAHESIADPVRLGLDGMEEKAAFRVTRDEIRQRIVALVRRNIGAESPEGEDMSEQTIKSAVRKHYATIAMEDREGCCAPPTSKGSCCSSTSAPGDLSRKIGYAEQDLAEVPEGANLGLGCGNPVALASLKEGEVVVDLGSGAGFDCFLAARKVGGSGRVIGVDMTHEMLDKARENARKGGYENVEFRLGEIENLPVADRSADVVLSNCVINLSTDKARTFREAFRVLKAGGRLMVSDLALARPLPPNVRRSLQAYAGCISGALMKEDYLEAVRAAGFREVQITGESSYPVGSSHPDETEQALFQDESISPEEMRAAADAVVSIKVQAVKL
jgi:arsenite methyltransferase